jgi:hypothetical protein
VISALAVEHMTSRWVIMSLAATERAETCSKTKFIVSLKIGSCSFYRQIIAFLRTDISSLCSLPTFWMMGIFTSWFFCYWFSVGAYIQTYPLVPIIAPTTGLGSPKNSIIWFFILLMKFESTLSKNPLRSFPYLRFLVWI